MSKEVRCKELTIMEFTIEAVEDIAINQFLGSILHGVMMESIDPEYASYLHQQELRPYSQYVYFHKEQRAWKWRIASLTQEAADNLLQALWALPDTVRLKQRNGHIRIVDRAILRSTTYHDLVQQYWGGDVLYQRGILNFMSSTTFKSYGEYVLYPDLFNVWKSLLNKWNAFTTKERLDTKDFMEPLMKHSNVWSYNLRMSRFSLERVRLNAFKGSLSIQFKRNMIMQRSMALLVAFSEFSGLGAKAALGMGGTQVKLEAQRERTVQE